MRSLVDLAQYHDIDGGLNLLDLYDEHDRDLDGWNIPRIRLDEQNRDLIKRKAMLSMF